MRQGQTAAVVLKKLNQLTIALSKDTTASPAKLDRIEGLMNRIRNIERGMKRG